MPGPGSGTLEAAAGVGVGGEASARRWVVRVAWPAMDAWRGGLGLGGLPQGYMCVVGVDSAACDERGDVCVDGTLTHT